MTSRGAGSVLDNGVFHPRRGAGQAYFLLPLFWLMLSVVGVVAFVDAQAHRSERIFGERAEAVSSHFAEMEHGVNSVLEGFSAMLEVMNVKDVADRLMVSRYASQMRLIYPQVYMLEMIEEVPRARLPAFEKEESDFLNKSFRIRRFDFDQTRTWLPPEDKEAYYVTTFIEPETPTTSQVLGLDIGSSSVQASALHRAILSGQRAISTPYHTVKGPLAYMMIRPVNADQTRFAKLVIRADTIGALPWLKEQKDISISIRNTELGPDDPDGRLFLRVETPSSHLESALLPLFRWKRDMRDNSGDPFVIEVSRQMRWQDLDLPVLASIMLTLFVVLLVLVKMSFEHHSHDRERREHELHLAYLASHDSLTNLPNRSLLMDRLEQAILRAKRDSSHLALLFLDIDRFKSVNDNYGHDAGDRFLMTTADTIRETIRAQDTLARLSGDEFIVLLERVERRGEVDRIAAKIKENIQATICQAYRDIGVGISIGSAMYPDDGADAYSLLRHADTAMYDTKRGRPAASLLI
jgi:diguanylate cyclase (GGDEF)-like protein